MQLRSFLKLLLPEAGSKCWVNIDKSKKVFQGFTESFDDLATVLQGIDAQQKDAYFACAVFKDSSSRRAQNALAAQSFWLDVDCGEGKPYANPDVAIEALDAFADRLGVALPLVVRSGTGVHAYWPLSRPVPAQSWIPAAKLLKRVTDAFGLHADPTRTADISSILRPPGTFNYKQAQPLAVTVEDGDVETTEPEAFFHALAGVAGDAPPVPLTSSSPAPAGVASAILGSRTGKARPSMVQGFPDGQRTKALQERAGWCLGPDKMTEEETLAACRAWNAFNTPPLSDEKLVHDVHSYAMREAAKKPPAPPAPPSADAILDPAGSYIPVLPTGYKWGPAGELLRVYRDADGEPAIEVLAPYSIYLYDVCRREHEVITTYVFKQWHPHAGWYEFTMTADEMWGSHWLAALHKNGGDTKSKNFRNYVSDASVMLKGMKMDAVQYEQFGWKGNCDAFLIGNALIKKGGATEFAYGDTQLAARMKYLALPPGSSLAAWSNAANKLYALGYEAHGFALLAGFAAPLMKFVCGETDGGAVLALYSEHSGHGKTKVLEAIASIWGQFDGLATAGKDTANSKFNIISKACNLPVLEEELGERDPIKSADYIKDFTTGRDKNRAQRDGSVPMKNTRYQTVMISASNRSLYEIVKQSGDEGSVARIFELEVDWPDNDAFKRFRDVTAEMLANCGHAGRVYIHYLLHQPGALDWVQTTLLNLVDHYIKKLETKPEHRYVVWLMATCAVAAVIVNKAGILSFDVGRIMGWAASRALDRVQDKVATDPLEILNTFINEHAFDCLTVSGPAHPKKPITVIRYPQRALRLRLERETAKLYIPSEVLKSWLLIKNRPYAGLLKQLEVLGVLTNKSRMTTLSAGTDLAPARVLCWEIDLNHPAMCGVLREAIANSPGAEDQKVVKI